MYNSGQITLEQYYYMGWDEIWKEFAKSKKYKDIFTYDSFNKINNLDFEEPTN